MRLPRLSWRQAAVVVLAVAVPLGIASWAVTRTLAGTERTREQLRLITALRASTASLRELVAESRNRAALLGQAPAVEAAVAARTPGPLDSLTGGWPSVSFTARGTLLAGEPPVGVAASYPVLRREREVGRVFVWFRLDERLLRRLRDAASLEPGDVLALGRDGEAVAGAPPGVALPAPRGSPAILRSGSRRLYAVATELRAQGVPVRLAAMTPVSRIDARVAGRRERVVLAAAATFAALVAIALLLVPLRARPGRRTRRRRDPIDLFGDALAATHDVDALLPVVLEAITEATGARGGVLTVESREILRHGTPDAPPEARTALPLPGAHHPNEKVEIVLHPESGRFDDDTKRLAQSLAARAGVALENARLHRLAREQAVTDELTGLPNRRHFMDRLEIELSRAERFELPLAAVIADIDDFKRINDEHGHAFGDEVLRVFAEAFRRHLREIDLPARLGGEEFAVLLTETTLDGGTVLAERLRETIERLRIRVEGEQIRITASFGVAAFPETSTAKSLLLEADRALYRAKALGKNRVEAARPTPDAS